MFELFEKREQFLTLIKKTVTPPYNKDSSFRYLLVLLSGLFIARLALRAEMISIG